MNKVIAGKYEGKKIIEECFKWADGVEVAIKGFLEVDKKMYMKIMKKIY
ncbi:MAG: hypothetical protein ACRCX8_17775 [Sarcina sp.]